MASAIPADDEEIPAWGACPKNALLPLERREDTGHPIVPTRFAPVERLGASERRSPSGPVVSHVLVTTDASKWVWGGFCRNAHAN